MVGMTARKIPLDGERLFVAHYGNERTFGSPNSPTPRSNSDPMAAIVYGTGPRTRAASGLRPFRPSGHRLPSVAVRRRRAVWVLVILIALGSLLGAGSLAGAGQAGADPKATGTRAVGTPIVATVHVVQPGETLWTLARRLKPQGEIRPIVDRWQAEHGPGPLVPGDRLRLAV